MQITRGAHTPAQKEVERRIILRWERLGMFLISVEGPRRRKVKSERKRHYEVLENMKSICEECEELISIKKILNSLGGKKVKM